MDPSERVSSRLMCKRAALSTLNNNAAGLESDSSSKPIKRAKNTSRVRSRAYVARAEQDELGTGKTGASGKQQGSQKPSELPADEQGSANSGLEQPGSRTDKEQRSAENGHDKQGATEQPPPGGIGEGVNPGVRAGGIGGSKDRSNAGAPLEKGDAEKVRAGDGVNGRAQDANIQGGAGLSAEAAAQAAKSVAGDGVADRGVPAKAADAATATGAKDGAPQQSADAGAADDANEGGEMHGQATDVGESSQVNCRSTQQEAANEGVPRHSVNPSGMVPVCDTKILMSICRAGL